MNIFPDFDGLDVSGLQTVVGALLTIVLVVAVFMLIVSAIIWALSASSGNPGVAAKARAGVLVCLGAGVAWMNWLIALGRQL